MGESRNAEDTLQLIETHIGSSNEQQQKPTINYSKADTLEFSGYTAWLWQKLCDAFTDPRTYAFLVIALSKYFPEVEVDEKFAFFLDVLIAGVIDLFNVIIATSGVLLNQHMTKLIGDIYGSVPLTILSVSGLIGLKQVPAIASTIASQIFKGLYNMFYGPSFKDIKAVAIVKVSAELLKQFGSDTLYSIPNIIKRGFNIVGKLLFMLSLVNLHPLLDNYFVKDNANEENGIVLYNRLRRVTNGIEAVRNWPHTYDWVAKINTSLVNDYDVTDTLKDISSQWKYVYPVFDELHLQNITANQTTYLEPFWGNDQKKESIIPKINLESWWPTQQTDTPQFPRAILLRNRDVDELRKAIEANMKPIDQERFQEILPTNLTPTQKLNRAIERMPTINFEEFNSRSEITNDTLIFSQNITGLIDLLNAASSNGIEPEYQKLNQMITTEVSSLNGFKGGQLFITRKAGNIITLQSMILRVEVSDIPLNLQEAINQMALKYKGLQKVLEDTKQRPNFDESPLNILGRITEIATDTPFPFLAQQGTYDYRGSPVDLKIDNYGIFSISFNETWYEKMFNDLFEADKADINRVTPSLVLSPIDPYSDSRRILGHMFAFLVSTYGLNNLRGFSSFREMKAELPVRKTLKGKIITAKVKGIEPLLKAWTELFDDTTVDNPWFKNALQQVAEESSKETPEIKAISKMVNIGYIEHPTNESVTRRILAKHASGEFSALDNQVRKHETPKIFPPTIPSSISGRPVPNTRLYTYYLVDDDRDGGHLGNMIIPIFPGTCADFEKINPDRIKQASFGEIIGKIEEVVKDKRYSEYFTMYFKKLGKEIRTNEIFLKDVINEVREIEKGYLIEDRKQARKNLRNLTSKFLDADKTFFFNQTL